MNLHPQTNFNRNRRHKGLAVTPGLPHWSEEINARRLQLLAAEPKKAKTQAKVTQCPVGYDHRFTVRPGDPVPSIVDPSDCRPWAKVAR